jgi:hypothetical protein
VATAGITIARAEPTIIARELPPFMKIIPMPIATAATAATDITGSKNGSTILSFITAPVIDITQGSIAD